MDLDLRNDGELAYRSQEASIFGAKVLQIINYLQNTVC